MCAKLTQLSISNIRNLSSVNIELGLGFNVFTGPNGSGKTSLLEAIHYLANGKSFRAANFGQVVSIDRPQAVVRAQVVTGEERPIWVGVAKGVSDPATYKVNENKNVALAELTKIIPVQLIDVHSCYLVEGGPDYRRKFLDWGSFHVEHDFLHHWKRLKRIIEQRNASLKTRANSRVWDDGLIEHADFVEKIRKNYIGELVPVLNKLAADYKYLRNLDLQYIPGWDGASLKECLDKNFYADMSCGFTTCGPHRADLEILVDGKKSKEVLSRGQTKLLVCLMLLARAYLVPNSIFLVDDISSELDSEAMGKLLSTISSLGCQAIITGIELNLQKFQEFDGATKMFHVEHGNVLVA